MRAFEDRAQLLPSARPPHWKYKFWCSAGSYEQDKVEGGYEERSICRRVHKQGAFEKAVPRVGLFARKIKLCREDGAGQAAERGRECGAGAATS